MCNSDCVCNDGSGRPCPADTHPYNSMDEIRDIAGAFAPPPPAPAANQIEIHRANPATVARMKFAIGVAVGSVYDKQDDVTDADVGQTLEEVFELFAHRVIFGRVGEGNIPGAYINRVAMLSVLERMTEKINSWQLPPLPTEG